MFPLIVNLIVIQGMKLLYTKRAILDAFGYRFSSLSSENPL